MSISAQRLHSAEAELLRLDRTIESLRSRNDPGVSCDQIEESIRQSLPELRQVVSEFLDAWGRGEGARAGESEGLATLTRVGVMIPVLRSRVLEALREFEDASCSPNVAAECRACLTTIDSLLRPVEQQLQVALFRESISGEASTRSTPAVVEPEAEFIPDAWAGDPIGWALEQMGRMRRGTRIQPRVVPSPPIAPPGEPFEPEETTDEPDSAVDDLYQVPPFIPLPGPGVRVKAKLVDTWPIDPPITWRVRE